nr:flagellar basal-body MS-ring/collar protein FliF [uncultured Roseateles sp.]
MDNALLSPLDMNAAPPTGFGSRLVALPARSKIMMGLGVATLLAVLVAMSLWNSQGDYKPVFTGLSDKDGGAVIAQLATMNVPYKNEPGGTILVPASQVYDVRMKLASAGLPKGSVIGFELMDKQSIGQTQFNERLNFQRALEGELTRTITALADVADARVHLAMPQQNGFFREQQKPSASVMLTLRGGHMLDRAQVAGIIHLVSASVPELSPKAVSVLDHTGALLSSTGDTGSGLDSQQLQYKQQIEANFSKRIYELLEPVVGRDNLRASVTAEVDFSQTEATSEEFKPNQGANATASIRSLQSTESTNGSSAAPSGVPGAATNQPPVPATAPITGAAAPLQAAQGSANTSSRKDNTTNFEVDKTVRVTRNATGVVKRLNAAVILNNRSVTDPKGKTTQQPLPAEEIEKLTALVKETMGFNQERGDSIKLINAPFKVDKIEVPDVPIWQQPWLIDMVRAGAVPAALVLVALIAVFGMVRPAIRAAMAPPPAPEIGGQLDAVVDDENALPGQNALALPAPGDDKRLENIRAMAKENPAAVANIVRNWVAGETK